MSQRDQIAAFIESLAQHDGFPPFSDAKLPIDPDSGRVVVVADNDRIVAMGAVGSHVQGDGSVHRELETAVEPGMRFQPFEAAVLDAAMPLVDGSDSFSVWSRRSTLDSALSERGFTLARVLDFLTVDLPLKDSGSEAADSRIRGFEPDDVETMISINVSAFAGHREAGSLDASEMSRYRSEAWFDPDGIFIAESGGPAGFCWTKVHPNGDGEIFRIAVDPSHKGTGLGTALMGAGLGYLASRPEVRRGVLWVDRSNVSAMRLYRSLGMERKQSNSEFSPQ